MTVPDLDGAGKSVPDDRVCPRKAAALGHICMVPMAGNRGKQTLITPRGFGISRQVWSVPAGLECSRRFGLSPRFWIIPTGLECSRRFGNTWQVLVPGRRASAGVQPGLLLGKGFHNRFLIGDRGAGKVYGGTPDVICKPVQPASRIQLA